MDLGEISQLCYNITQSYLQINNGSIIIKETQKVIEQSRYELMNVVFKRWNPFNNEISFSYNGGKDCQVLLIIYLSCLWELFYTFSQASQFNYQIFPMKALQSVLISNNFNFPTIDMFLDETIARYNLDMYEYLPSNDTSVPKIPMTEAFEEYLVRNPTIEAIVVGVRRSDPYSENLSIIDSTDDGWPDFYRVQPILDWNLSNIWSFLLYSGEPICGLYAKGYTSIGDIDNTLPNPYLQAGQNLTFFYNNELKSSFNKNTKNITEENINISNIANYDRNIINSFNITYYPGWYLIDETLERAGRIKKQRQSS